MQRIVWNAIYVGIGLVDYMVKSQHDNATGEFYPDFGVYGGTQEDAAQEYKKYRTNDTEFDAMYLIKANAPINTEAHANVQAQLSSGKIKFLVDEKVAKNKLMGTAMGQKMNQDQRADYLKPFNLTSILREELLNLREENEGLNIILKQANRGIRKDKFSALEYGLYYIKQEEDSKKKKRKHKLSEFMFFKS